MPAKTFEMLLCSALAGAAAGCSSGAEAPKPTVVFVGNSAVAEAELRSVVRSAGEPRLTDDVIERDSLMISALYYDRGFLDVQVAEPEVDDARARVTFRITEGQTYRLRSIHLTVPPPGDQEATRRLLRLGPGDRFSRATLVEDFQAVRTALGDRGMELDFEPQTELHPEDATVDLRIVVRWADTRAGAAKP